MEVGGGAAAAHIAEGPPFRSVQAFGSPQTSSRSQTPAARLEIYMSASLQDWILQCRASQTAAVECEHLRLDQHKIITRTQMYTHCIETSSLWTEVIMEPQPSIASLFLFRQRAAGRRVLTIVEAMPRWRMMGTGTFSTAVEPAARQSRVSLMLPSGWAATAEKYPAVGFLAASAASAADEGRWGAGAAPRGPSRSTTLTWRAMGCSGDAPPPAPRFRHSICGGGPPGGCSAAACAGRWWRGEPLYPVSCKCNLHEDERAAQGDTYERISSERTKTVHVALNSAGSTPRMGRYSARHRVQNPSSAVAPL